MWASVTANAAGVGGVILLAALALARRSKVLVASAYLGLLGALTWCAFPFLGSTES